MNCGKIQNLLSAYIDGELTGQDQLLIRGHLNECSSCADEHESFLTTKRMISGLAVMTPSAELEEMIIRTLGEEELARNRRRQSPIAAWWLTLPFGLRVRFAGAFAVCALALAAGRIIPTFMTPSPETGLAKLVVDAPPPSAFRRDIAPVNDVIFISNPGRNAPVGNRATPVGMADFRAFEPR